MTLLSDLTRSPAKAIGLALIQFAILVTGMAVGSAKYTDSDFAPRYLPTLAVVAVLFAAVTALMGPARREMGLRVPELHNTKWLLPGVVMVVAGAVAFAMTWASLPDGASVDGNTMARTLLATTMVGFTEEWMYRGLLLAVMVHRLGFRNGSLLSAVAFGVFHIGNLVAGAPMAAVLQQVVFTALLGLTFYLMAVGTRSLIPGMIAHALYDFFLLAMEQLADAGAEKFLAAAVITPVAALIGLVIALRHLTTTNDTDPYPVL